jgi:hypothetical protein
MMFGIEDNFIKFDTNKYLIKFDTDKLPLDFDKWIWFGKNEQVDKNPINANFTDSNEFILLNCYQCVVIDSIHENFTMNLGGLDYVFEKGIKYIPFFPKHHEVKIKLSPGIKIFIDPSLFGIYGITLNKKHELIELSHLICYYTIIFDKLNVCDDYRYQHFGGRIEQIVITSGMMVSRLYPNAYLIDSNEFYFYLENTAYKNNSIKSSSIIYLIDKYIQYEYIKILSVI